MINHFLQSKEWEGFQKSIGREVFRVDGVLVARLPLAFEKSYLYSAGGGYIKIPTAFLKNDVFFKLEPMLALRSLGEVGAENGELPQELLKAGFKKSKKEIQPQSTIILDISKSESEILSKMHEKTRYNIRLAQKKGLEIKNYEKVSVEIFEKFWQILQKTSGRDKFSSHTEEYYKKLLELPSTKLFVAKRGGEIVAANIILFHEDRAIYLHGASDHEYRSLMAPYILHWEAIKHAKENRFKEYDLWGIDEKKWPGVTRFKRGFSGREVAYTGSYDYVIQPFWYKLYNLYRKLKTKS